MRRLLCTGMLLFLAGCGGDDQATRPNDFTLMTSIEIISPLASIAPLTSIPLKAVGNFSGLFTRDITDRVLWESTTPTLAEFPSLAVPPLAVPGRVKGLATGTATLTATLGEISGSYDLEVSAATVSTLTISPAAPTVPKGLTLQLTASGTFSDATSQDLTFDAVWSSSNDLVTTVSDAFTSKGLAKGIDQGSATISVDFIGTGDSVTLNVTAPALQSITLAPANPTILSLLKTTFKATGQYSDGTTPDPDITSLVAWSSSQPLVATIAVGEVITLKSGSTVIGAALGGVNASTSLKVTGGDLSGISLSPTNPTMAVGTSQRIIATGSFSNGTRRDITGQVDWTVVDSTMATVARDNSLAWLKADAATVPLTPATIFARRGAVEGSTPLTVENLTLSSLSISPAPLDLTVGTSRRFTVTGSYIGGHTQDLTSSAAWTSTSTAVEVLDLGVEKGRVKGLIATTTPVTITATSGVQTATATVGSIVQRTLQSLAISAQPTTFIPGTQVPFTATATYSDGTIIDVTEDTVWSVDKTNVAIFTDAANDPGQVVAVDSGTATLTATFGGMTATQILTVTVP